MKGKKIQIILAEDHQSLREAYSRFIQTESDIRVIGEASNGKELLELLKTKRPDIILLDLEMPVLNGYNTLPILRKEYPDIKVIILTTHNHSGLLAQLMSAGASAYLPKQCRLEDIIETIRKVKEDGYFLSPKISKLLVSKFIRENKQDEWNDLVLSPKELEVLELYCGGKPYKDIAIELGISLNTIKYHLKNIFRKTELSSITQLVKYAIKYGITTMDYHEKNE